jgi:hypothetical protein
MHRLIAAALVAFAVVGASSAAAQSAATSTALTAQAQPVASATFTAGNFCLTRNTPEQYDAMFDSEPGGVIGADYQRATRLPDGNVLWTFQDAEIRLPNGTSTLVHNIGMIQTGTCFAVLLGGTPAAPQPWRVATQTTPFFHWYWPLDATMSSDGRVYVYLVEMFEYGATYLERVVPTSTAVAAINIDNWNVESQGPAGNNSPDLYGWTSETDDEWTYLYAHCYRQFGYDPFFGGVRIHDSDCTDEIRVARVPKGALFDPYEYWTGEGWSTLSWRAEPIVKTTGRLVNPADITHVNNQWLAVIKVDDWFGDEILIESSARPTGPFKTIAVLTATPKCDPGTCNTYFASWIPSSPDGQMTIGLSNNRWDGVLSNVYRPAFQTIPTPEHQTSQADRCSIGQCD